MTQHHSTIVKRTFKHLSDIDRGQLQAMYRSGLYTQKEMADMLEVSQSTISRELKRGMTEQVKLVNGKREHYQSYFGDVGARVYRENRERSRQKGIEKYDQGFFKVLPEALKPPKGEPRIHSVDTITHVYRKDNPDKRVPCMKTVYNLIDRGELDVRNIDLPRKTRLRPRPLKTSDPHGTNKRKLGRSIEERDPAVLTREEFGHWELDLVIGKKTKGEPVILTLLERQTRHFVTKKLWNKSPEYIREAMLKIINEHGPQNFKTITTDNGSEFRALSKLEDTCEHLSVYYAHAYASWEKRRE
ncbi:Transposase and inactivated derivatives, IS30 family [Pelagirhabdus alkalitolerans]|uniref:Transposase and inactivated derivatives, IS30 family n=1 Tax=Pelagirhabdus alkalitolerans TaxID=1612202 RepID=A0A1G6N0B5_9BACI|nr:IS30 family transposase [Pelagirhabdus alkalitolerans]SDC61279.1 Transposase and inactivated derivatives, IS30 family [Pelagirhabdus alkalitolerans]